MRKLWSIFLILPHLIFADAWYFAFKPGYFYPSDKDWRKVFDNGGFIASGEIDYRFVGPFAIWFEGGYYSASGTAIHGNELTNVELGNVTLGLKIIGDLNQTLSVYVGGAPRLFFLRIKNHSPYVKSETSTNKVGQAYTAGILIFPRRTKHLYFDLFAEYGIKKIHVQPNSKSSFTYDTRVDGLTAGLGIGYKY